MKTITILAEQVSEKSLSAALPNRGVASVTISRDLLFGGEPSEMAAYRGFVKPLRFTPNYRIDLVVEDAAVEAVFDGVDFAYGAGLFSDAEMWVNAPALALSA
ncbi:MAG: hypothetical protein ACR2JM_11380 [Mycobacterium sp.]